jgi:hypothetical protein
MSVLLEKRPHFREIPYVTMAVVRPLHRVQIVRYYLVELLLLYYFLWLCSPARAMASSFTRFRDHTQRRATVGRDPLDE